MFTQPNRPNLLRCRRSEFQGFSLHANKKTIEGKSHPDRDAQFAYLNSKCQEFERKGAAIISVDCMKK
jgi:hypothetical protein